MTLNEFIPINLNNGPVRSLINSISFFVITLFSYSPIMGFFIDFLFSGLSFASGLILLLYPLGITFIIFIFNFGYEFNEYATNFVSIMMSQFILYFMIFFFFGCGIWC